MNWFWHAILIALVLIPVTILWISCVFDIFTRDDLGGASRVLWVLAILLLPILGALVYLVTRPRMRLEWAARHADEDSLTHQLSELDRMRANGSLDEREFQIAKQDALAHVPAPRGADAKTSTVPG